MKTKEEEISRKIVEMLKDKIERSGLKTSDVNAGFDLVRTGLLDSLTFVDFVVEMEGIYQIEIDFEEAFKKPEFTTVKGLTETLANEIK